MGLQVRLDAPWAASAQVVGNAQQLRDLLVDGKPAARVVAEKADRGCGPAGCSVELAGLTVLRERGGLQDGSGKRLLLQQGGRGLPQIDWDPIEGYAVWRGGERWGSCLEFAHTGIGKSGPYQRWSSVVLVPWPTAPQARPRGGCKQTIDARPVAPLPGSDSGALQIGP